MVITRLLPSGGRMSVTGFFVMTVPVLGCRIVAMFMVVPVLGGMAMGTLIMAALVRVNGGFTMAGAMVML
jgi:hypothetical protein